MARLARVVAPGLPHHVTQRGNWRQQVFFDDADYRVYLDLLAAHARAAGVALWDAIPGTEYLIDDRSGRP